MSKEKQFIETIAPVVKSFSSPLYPSIRIAQACLESDYGRSELALKAHNYFGIKASRPWQGSTYTKESLEVLEGQAKLEQAAFRQYESLEQSVADHAQFVNSTPYRKDYYRQVIQAQSIDDQAQALTGTYATDPHYGQKLIRLIQRHQLEQYDQSVVIYSRLDEALGGQQQDRKLSDIKRIVWHYTAVARELDRKISDHERYWQSAHGWGRGGYHYYIDSQGKIYQNYRLERITWGVAHHNQDTVHISVEANHRDNYSSAQIQSREKLTLDLLTRLDLPAQAVVGHWEVYNNSLCPGYTGEEMSQFRTVLSQKLKERRAALLTTTSPQKSPNPEPLIQEGTVIQPQSDYLYFAGTYYLLQPTGDLLHPIASKMVK